MVELTIEQVIKIIIYVFVIIMVVIGIYLAFKNYIIPYFENIGPSNSTIKFVLALLK